MTIPLYIFYFIYLGLVVISLIFSFFNIYHLVRFGYLSLANFTVIVFYIIFTILILAISWHYTSQIDWQESLELIPPSGIYFEL